MKTRAGKFILAAALAVAWILCGRFGGLPSARKADLPSPWTPPPELVLGAAVVAGRPKRKVAGHHTKAAVDQPTDKAATAETADRLALVLAIGKMGIWTQELGGRRRVRLSPELEAMIGLSPGEFAETAQAFYDLVHPEDRELFRETCRRAIEARTDCEVEFRLLSPKGAPVWVLARGRAWYDPSGKPLRMSGVFIDITARKQAEHEGARANADLERRVQERTAQLEATNRELEAFAYSVSHDLRAPLRGIRGFSEVLLEHHAAQLNVEGRNLLRRACDASNRMNALIDDLLKLSRIGRSDLHWQPVNLSRLAESIAAELHRAEPAREVEVAIEPNLSAEGDEHLLRIMLDNLLRNAWKFTARQPRGRVEFGFIAEPEPAFYVRDNGVGFDAAHAGKLFGVFQRLHSVSEFPGTGVGLAIVQRIIQRHQGKLWATATVNQGATFYFTLPGTQDFNV